MFPLELFLFLQQGYLICSYYDVARGVMLVYTQPPQHGLGV